MTTPQKSSWTSAYPSGSNLDIDGTRYEVVQALGSGLQLQSELNGEKIQKFIPLYELSKLNVTLLPILQNAENQQEEIFSMTPEEIAHHQQVLHNSLSTSHEPHLYIPPTHNHLFASPDHRHNTLSQIPEQKESETVPDMWDGADQNNKQKSIAPDSSANKEATKQISDPHNTRELENQESEKLSKDEDEKEIHDTSEENAEDKSALPEENAEKNTAKESDTRSDIKENENTEDNTLNNQTLAPNPQKTQDADNTMPHNEDSLREQIPSTQNHAQLHHDQHPAHEQSQSANQSDANREKQLEALSPSFAANPDHSGKILQYNHDHQNQADDTTKDESKGNDPKTQQKNAVDQKEKRDSTDEKTDNTEDTNEDDEKNTMQEKAKDIGKKVAKKTLTRMIFSTVMRPFLLWGTIIFVSMFLFILIFAAILPNLVEMTATNVVDNAVDSAVDTVQEKLGIENDASKKEETDKKAEPDEKTGKQ